ncbi:LuxR family transcriptional regulator [Arthrobacter sp. CJ23]|uniref:helix-turn-helix transcriptional regulator n=1 Tax=Arthrobacter sp. CJ23 TaxID=2972479 RepID=UPI00215D1DE7|nr:LuxR family transcriptional regulator [Arthrobacter sp. CJ23]UVJ38259.1 LuxR C-terminal-related transcriptional regulator [Arthrobacter sp. CJ23]
MASPKAGLDLGRSAYEEHRWGDAFEHLVTANAEGGLPAADLERLATAAMLTGQSTFGIDTLTRSHEEFLVMGDAASAARCAGWLGLFLINQGEMARSAGWLLRARRLVEELDEPGPVEGFLLIPDALGKLYGGDVEGAAVIFGRAFDIGTRFRDKDLVSLAQLGQGQAKIMLGQTVQGLGLLDEVMVAVTAGELSPVPSGIIYCAVIGACHLVFDVHRALEWTAALDHWCAGRPDMVLFSGQCQSHRAQLYVLHGQWPDALAAAGLALDRAARGDPQSVYGGFYQQGEVQRLRGELDAAETSYREAGNSGYEPQPGLALIHLARGDSLLAQGQIRRAAATTDLASRHQLLPALVDIELATGDIAAARSGAEELKALAEAFPVPMVQAHACQADGAVLLEEGDPAGALKPLRRAWTTWRSLDVPFEAARCRILVGRACRLLGDEDSALMDFEAARRDLLDLGAKPAVAAVDSLLGVVSPGPAGPLTRREVEVLRLVAAGKTNRAVAVELYLSEKTVARHLSNIFLKLGLSSRTAATAYAYDHGLAG